MLQYLIILLDDASTSYCHYNNPSQSRHQLIDLADLKAGIRFAMKENLMIQYVYPDYDLPQEYKETIETIDHSKIIPSNSPLVEEADVVVFNDWKDTIGFSLDESATYVLRINKKDLFAQKEVIETFISKVARLNIVLTDVETFTENDFSKYKSVLDSFGEETEKLYKAGLSPQLNLITDRIALTQMNNCNAGSNNITLAPDGGFYVCPAFYYSEEDKETFCVGDLKNGLAIKAAKLYKLAYAPLCRICDAYQCKRCVWINRKMTYDITTPSHEQCVLAHLERNASRKVLESVRKDREFYPEQDIKEIDYLDPFDVRIDWHKI
jgi:CXXX repeat peptide maturase